MGLAHFGPLVSSSYHLLSCPTFCFNFLFFLYLRPLQPDLYGSQMCPGKLPEVRHRPQMLLWDVIALQQQVDVCALDLLLGFSHFFSSILNFGSPCHTLFFGQFLRRSYMKVDRGGTKANMSFFLQWALQFAGQCQLCNKGGEWQAAKSRELSWITKASFHQ